ncbi:MAG: hypothetical protein Q9195_000132 [Heterodermia aff. obscurata]
MISDGSSGRRAFQGGHNGSQRTEPVDRPKTKHLIPGCPQWLLVKTKLGRRFVYNPEKGESFWKFPLEVTKGVVEYDRLEREKKQRIERGGSNMDEDAEITAAAEELRSAETAVPGASLPTPAVPAPTNIEDDSDEYEEVEVTDDEDEGNLAKRKKTEDHENQPVEFNEDDIAYQLAAMGEDYGLDPGEYGEDGGAELEEGAEGLALTEEDSSALFKDMLNDYNVSPYTTWETLIEAGHIVEDGRYTVLPNMRSRKEVWGDWSRQRIQQLKEQREREFKKDPKIPYLAFLQKHATPKLYWPEFRRKYKKEPEMRDSKLHDREREKMYRDYISRLKLPESTLKSDLAALLKFLPIHVLNRSSNLENLPPAMLSDIRYVSLKPSIRDPLIEAHVSELPPAPTNIDVSPEEYEVELRKRQERERRERALAARQMRVEEEKRKQRGVLHHSKGLLREGEQELERAKRVGKEGLLGYIESDNIPVSPTGPAGS